MTGHYPFDDALEELITGVDDDGVAYPIGKLDAHRASIRHRAVSIFLFRDKRLLLQQRAAAKYHAPLQWANSACSHPRWGEASAVCADRTVRRELGLTTPLRRVTTTAYEAPVGHLFENEIVDCFRGDIAQDVELDSVGSAEVADLKLMSLMDIQDAIARQPHAFTPWFLIYVDRGLVATVLES